jgi:Rps23 Pro-64 3,4-dihydroxylase Tpa1-like proline 4-hydroxylase
MENLLNYSLTDGENLNHIFSQSQPVPSILLENFLKEDFALQLHNECNTKDDSDWKVFTRNGSHMKEYNNIENLPVAQQFYSFVNSSQFLIWLENLTGIQNLIPDPHLVGAGYSKSYKGDTLKIHTDFNWNDRLKLYRVLSLIVYLTPDWKYDWNGGLDFYDKDRNEAIKTYPCSFNNCAIWEYDERGFHGYLNPIDSPEDITRNSIRAFYYVSDGEYRKDFTPHRSLYWFDEQTGTPFDRREEI